MKDYEKLLPILKIHAFELLQEKAAKELIAQWTSPCATEDLRAKHRLLEATNLHIKRLQKRRDYLEGAMHLLRKAREHTSSP